MNANELTRASACFKCSSPGANWGGAIYLSQQYAYMRNVPEVEEMLIAGQQGQAVERLHDPVERINLAAAVPPVLESRTDSMLARIMGTVISSVKAGFLFLGRVFEYPLNKLASL